jgi:diacylglycerol kinase (ATP)
VPITVQLLVNPASGSYAPARVAALVAALQAAGAQVRRTDTVFGEHPVLMDDVDQLCIAGGDGTARIGLDALANAGRSVPVSIYPMGTINLVARECLYPRDPKAFAERVIRTPQKRVHHVGIVGGRAFVACASVGPDSAAVAGVSTRLKKRIGRAAYGVALGRQLIDWPTLQIMLTADDRAVDCAAFFVAKGRYFAGPWQIASAARLHDPMLHIVALKSAGRLAYARFMLAVMRGKPLDRDANITAFTTRKLIADCAKPFPVQADGDYVGRLPATFSVREQAQDFL